jgi:hypothetical protein
MRKARWRSRVTARTRVARCPSRTRSQKRKRLAPSNGQGTRPCRALFCASSSEAIGPALNHKSHLPLRGPRALKRRSFVKIRDERNNRGCRERFSQFASMPGPFEAKILQLTGPFGPGCQVGRTCNNHLQCVRLPDQAQPASTR